MDLRGEIYEMKLVEFFMTERGVSKEEAEALMMIDVVNEGSAYKAWLKATAKK